MDAASGVRTRPVATAATGGGGHHAVYVWEAPIRLWHWVMMFAMFVLIATGFLIGVPPPSVGGEATFNFWFGYIRFLHFAAGYVFAIMFVLRVYWAIVGNKFAREIFVVPYSMLSWKFWDGLIHQTLYYLFVHKESRGYQGHNPLAAAAMFFMYLLGSVWIILSGFALYGEGTGMGTWQFTFFTSWLQPLIGDSQALHTWHRVGMWYLILFSIVHMYMVVREDVFSKETVISTMVNGWRVPKP
ncbi:MAG: Ni/Fe-hydrogenase, b-type cytochrome subunit [Burkholderiaceae bacterium]|jgi:Ni/Fe-hydrogenase 1 B-type cytochrome subunit|nr:Ni/Fe-hydrogenase, b-type cytochrome subunit [Burkholderiaceae bacterium]